MSSVWIRAAGSVMLSLALVSCGGGGGGDATSTTPTTPTTPAVTPQQAIATAAAVAANDSATNSASAFAVVQAAGVPAVTVNSPPKINFTVISDGKVKTGLTLSNVSFAIAKLVPGTNGDMDQWVNYVYRTESTATAPNNVGSGANGAPALASAKQATTDPKQTDPALAAAQLVFNPDGYYTYTFKTDIKDPTQTNGVVFEPSRTHRIAIQLSYKNAAGDTVLVNPYYDFTIDANGNSVPVTDPTLTRKMVDVNQCNGCHDKLALHGGGRVDTNYCVMCHNPGTTDANSGNVLTMATMVHKIHSGRAIAEEQGDHYTIWGFGSSKHDYAEVGFPQPTRNCVVCHTGANTNTPQGDNWKSRPSKEACLTCHNSKAGSAFETTHVTTLKVAASVAAISNATCTQCHSATGTYAPEKVHWMQELANAANYKAVIDSIKIKTAPTASADGTLTVKVAIVNPTNNNTAYDLREGCTGANRLDQGNNTIKTCNTNYRWDTTNPPGAPQDKFGTFTVYVGSETIAGVTLDDVTDTKSVAAYLGVDDGTHHYTVNVPIAKGSKGNVRVLMIGSVAERRVDPITKAPTGAVPPTQNSDLAYVPVRNVIADFSLSTGAVAAAGAGRRQIVSTDNCNACHGILGLPTGGTRDALGFHKAVRNNAEGCAVCHNANQAGSYTLMADGTKLLPLNGQTVAGNSDSLRVGLNATNQLHESYQAKRFVHGVHYGEMRNFPFTHCMTSEGTFNLDGTNAVAGQPAMACDSYPYAPVNFTAEVTYPGASKACDNCHIQDSWKKDRSTMGTVVFKPTGKTDPLDWFVASPQAATCTTCHDATKVQSHVVNTGGGSFGNHTQRDLLFGRGVFEACEGCHVPGSALGVDMVHKR